MCQKPTGPFLYTLHSGQPPSLVLAKIVLPLTPHSALAPPHWPELMVKFTEQGQTSCVHMELVHSLVGLMIICLLAYLVTTLGDTTSDVSNRLRTLQTGVGTSTEVIFGSGVTSLKMAHLRNLMKIVVSHVLTYPVFPLVLSRTSTSPIISAIST